MEKNVGGIDRKIRIVAGIGIIAAGIIYASWWGALGIIPIITALLCWCPPYALLGLSSCKLNQKKP